MYMFRIFKMQSDMMFIYYFNGIIIYKVITEQIAVANIQMLQTNLIRFEPANYSIS